MRIPTTMQRIRRKDKAISFFPLTMLAFLPLFLAQTRTYQMSVKNRADVPLRIISARITKPTEGDWVIDLKVQNVGAIPIYGFRIIFPDGPRHFNYSLQPGDLIAFSEEVSPADLNTTEALAFRGELSSWAVSALDAQFGNARVSTGPGIPIQLDLSTKLETPAEVEASLPQEGPYFLQQAPESASPLHGMKVLGYAWAYVEIKNTSKELLHGVRYRFDGFVGARWVRILEDQLQLTIPPDERIFAPIRLPVEALDGGVKHRFERLRLVVTGVVLSIDEFSNPSSVSQSGADNLGRRHSGRLSIVEIKTAGGTPDVLPVFLNKVQANYTEEALRDKVEGVIRLRALVGVDGRVKDVRLTGHLPSGLDEQALMAVYRTEFKPAIRDGRAVPFWVVIDVRFTL